MKVDSILKNECLKFFITISERSIPKEQWKELQDWEKWQTEDFVLQKHQEDEMTIEKLTQKISERWYFQIENGI